jgi:hypothetical protein
LEKVLGATTGIAMAAAVSTVKTRVVRIAGPM